MNHHNIVAIMCSCGHEGLVQLPHFIPRNVVLEKAVCSACGRRGAADMVVPTNQPRVGADPVGSFAEQVRGRGS